MSDQPQPLKVSYGKPKRVHCPSHPEIVAAVAKILEATWKARVELPVRDAQGVVRRRIDLVAECHGYTVGFEIKGCWDYFRAEVIGKPRKHQLGAACCNEFYFVLPEAKWDQRYSRDITPADAGLMVLADDGELRILKPAPKR